MSEGGCRGCGQFLGALILTPLMFAIFWAIGTWWSQGIAVGFVVLGVLSIIASVVEPFLHLFK